MEMKVKSVGELEKAARSLLEIYPDKNIFAFYGELGAGKTALIKVICRLLGVTDEVQSPTFAIINEYRIKTGGPLYHFDFYRIRKPEEALDIGFEEYLGSGCYCFIEWPEMVEKYLPEEVVKVTISGQEERTIRF